MAIHCNLCSCSKLLINSIALISFPFFLFPFYLSWGDFSLSLSHSLLISQRMNIVGRQKEIPIYPAPAQFRNGFYFSFSASLCFLFFVYCVLYLFYFCSLFTWVRFLLQLLLRLLLLHAFCLCN